MLLQSSRRFKLKEVILNFVQHSQQISQLHKSEVEFPPHVTFCSFDGGWQRGKLHKVRFYSLLPIGIKEECSHCTHKKWMSDLAVVFLKM